MRPPPPRPDAPRPGDTPRAPSADAASDSCAGCAAGSPDRRRFLRDAVVALAASLAAMGLSTDDADALPWATVSATEARGDTRRYPIPAADGVSIDREAEVILARWQGAVYAFNLACPHQNVALRWQDGDQRFQCPKHKSRYRADGAFISGRATRGLDRFAVSRDGAAVVVDLAALYKQDADPAGWSAAVVRLA